MLEVGGFLFFFRALERGDLAVVAPIIGLEGGIAALAVFAFGERVGAVVVLGLAIALLGGCLSAAAGRAAHGRGRAAGGGRRGLLRRDVRALRRRGGPRARVGRRRGPPQRADAAGGARRVAPRAASPPAPSGGGCSALGVVDATAFVAYSWAASRGPVSVAAVVAGQFSTLSAVVGIVLLRERLRPHQYVGIALAGAGTALLALAQ